MGITVGIDTGGTFTDLVAVDEATGRWHGEQPSVAVCFLFSYPPRKTADR